MDDIKALFFDVGGTVFDWKNTARGRIGELADAQGQTIDSEAFASDWRKGMFKVHAQVRQGDLPWMNADEMHLRALDELTGRYPLLAAVDRPALVESTWSHLRPFAGAPEAIARLRTRYTVVVLTILSWRNIVSSSKDAGVQWDGILSCEFLGVYKPSLEAYRKGVGLLGLEPSQAMMVAAHDGDLAAARSTGMRTALVAVPEEDETADFGPAGEAPFDIEVADFEALCERLGV